MTDQLVRVTNTDPRYRAGFVAPELYAEIDKQSQSFEVVSGQQFCPFSLTGTGDAEQVDGPCTTANWFALQHASAMLGRTFAPDEDQHGRDKVVVLGQAFWQRKFHGDREVVGRAIRLNGAAWTIIGVMPPGFRPLGVLGEPDIYTPDVITENPAGLIVTARLKPAASLAGARAELKALGERLVRAEPAKWKGTGLTLAPALEDLTGAQRPLLFLLMGAVCFVLLIACANVADLLLARSKARQHEMQIRMALGASRSRMTQFLLTEVLLLCSVASLLAIGIAYLGISSLRPLLTYLPRADEISIDTRVFGWALAIGWLATLLAGAVPVLRSVELRDVAGMRTRSTMRWQASLLTAEVALTLMLLVGAGLLVRTFVNLRNAKLGYDPRNTLTSFLALPDGYKAEPAELLYARIRERLAAVPGVRSVATASSTPAGGVDMSIDVEPEGQVVPAGPKPATATVNMVSPDYFRTMGIQIEEGRAFTAEDRRGGAPAAIISESIARKYFGSKAMGRRMRVPAVNFALTDAQMTWAEVVGVVGSVAVSSAGERTAEHIYLPEAQTPVRFAYVLMRTEADPQAFVSAMKRVVREESPLTPLDEVKSMEERTSYLIESPRRAMWLLGLFAGLAGVLAATGIYAVSAYLAAQRTREMAIRMALGADRISLIGAICRKPFSSVLAGMLLGVIGAVWLTKLLNSLLYGVGHIDLLTYAGTSAALLVCAFTAMVRPAVRAMRMDVANTLREE